MINLLLLLLAFGSSDPIDSSNPYDFDEQMKMASEKVMDAEESMGFGSGTAIFDESYFDISLIVIALIIGIGVFFGLIIFLKTRKNGK